MLARSRIITIYIIIERRSEICVCVCMKERERKRHNNEWQTKHKITALNNDFGSVFDLVSMLLLVFFHVRSFGFLVVFYF